MAQYVFSAEQISEFFENLDFGTQREIFRESAVEHYPDDDFFDFDEDFFEEMGIKALDAIRSWNFGGKPGGQPNNYNDEYIRYNGYANFVTMDEYEAREWMGDHIDDMQEYIADNYRDELLEYFEIEEDEDEEDGDE